MTHQQNQQKQFDFVQKLSEKPNFREFYRITNNYEPTPDDAVHFANNHATIAPVVLDSVNLEQAKNTSVFT